MAEALSPEEQIMALRRELAERDAIIATREAELAEAAAVKAKLTAALLEIEQIKIDAATGALPPVLGEIGQRHSAARDAAGGLRGRSR
jgi:hypothetical protein